MSDKNVEPALEKYFLDFYGKYKAELGHYFRNLYHVLLYVDQSAIGSRVRYEKILRAQLSEYELTLLFYNCLCGYGVGNFRELVEGYAFF